MMSDSQFDNFIKAKGYKTSNQFNHDPKNLHRLIKYIENLPIERQSFNIIESLLKFYRTPLFIACKPFYQKIQDNYEENKKYFEEPIQEIASLVKSYLESFKLDQLSFFYIMGVSKKKKKSLQKSQAERNFLKYIETLGKSLHMLKIKIKEISPQVLKLQLDKILASSLDRKLNPLQMKYEQYFKDQASKIYIQNQNKLQQNQTKDDNRKGLQPRPQFESQKRENLCCRKFFYDQQTIKEAENSVSQYKQYFFPFNEEKIKVLKKTICAFLNTDGGIIYLGIQQNVDTKRRRVLGMQLDEAQKENLQTSFRRDIMSYIEPDIIVSKMYSMSYVPIKESNPPYHYIAGRYLVKIYINYGLRNQIYSYKHGDKDYFSFRTQNQVIHKQGREILTAYRQRLKKPAPVPAPRYHEGPCARPQEGNPILADIPKYQFYSGPVHYSSNSLPSSQKKKYKQKDAMDFILTDITQQTLLKQMTSQNIPNNYIIANKPQAKVCLVKTKNIADKSILIQFLSKLESCKLCQFFEIQREISINQKGNIQFAIQILTSSQLKFSLQQQHIFVFKSSQQATQAFILLRQFKIKTNFVT